MRTIATMIFIMLFPTMVLAELPIGEIPPKVVLKEDLGGGLTVLNGAVRNSFPKK